MTEKEREKETEENKLEKRNRRYCDRKLVGGKNKSQRKIGTEKLEPEGEREKERERERKREKEREIWKRKREIWKRKR